MNPTENRSATEMNRIVATMDDLPELPFEKVLSYLSLEDRLKARAVSRRWYHLINSFKVKTLCYSEWLSGFIPRKGLLVSGAFAQNFISSPRFDLFFNTFRPTILSNLKHLRICDLEPNDPSTFVSALNLFGRLEELDLIRSPYSSAASGLDGEVELNLPMLISIHLEQVEGIDQLTLDSSKLKRVKLLDSPPSLRLKLVHTDSVEWLATDAMAHVEVKNLKSLKYLHCGQTSEIDSTLLSGLEQLKEVYLRNRVHVPELFEQKQRYGLTDLKIFLLGFLLNGPDDPFPRFEKLKDAFVHLAKNPSRLADEVPFLVYLPYVHGTMVPDGVFPESMTNILRRFTDLSMIVISRSIPVQDVQRFLNLLKNLPNIVSLHFSRDQPQDLFNRLPEHLAVEYLVIDHPVADFRFLFKLEHLIVLDYRHQIPAEVVQKAFEELQFLWRLKFQHLNKPVSIDKHYSNRYTVLTGEKETNVADLNAAIQLAFGRTQQKKRSKRR